MQGSSFKHLTHKSRLTSDAHWRPVSARLLLPDHLLSFRGCPSSTHASSRALPNRDTAFRFLCSSARHPRRDETRVPWESHTRQRPLAPANYRGIGLHWCCGRLLGLCLYPSCDASSILDHPIRTTLTHHHHLEPPGSHPSLSLVPSLQHSTSFPISITAHLTPPSSPLPTLAPPLQCCLRRTKWLPTRRRQNRPWGTGLSNRRLVCSSRAAWVGWKMDVTQASKARACRPRRHIPW